MSQFISLEKAVTMTSLFRGEKENILALNRRNQNILPRCETFDRGVLDKLLAQDDCQALRIYYGMEDNLKVHTILVGVDSNDEDILPNGDESIGEESRRCPMDCPPPSDLNP